MYFIKNQQRSPGYRSIRRDIFIWLILKIAFDKILHRLISTISFETKNKVICLQSDLIINNT